MKLFDYNKPGPGISVEQAKKRSFTDIFIRHFWDLVKANLTYVLFNIIIIAAVLFLWIPYFINYKTVLDSLFSDKYILLPILPFLPFCFIGPFKAGMTYVIRNFSMQQHTYIFSDMWEHSVKNLRQSIILSTVSTVALYFILSAAIFYMKSSIVSNYIVIPVTIYILLLYTFMDFYIYPIMVTFDSTIKNILKNSFLLAIGKLWQNFLILVVLFATHGLLLWFAPFIWCLLMVLILFSFSFYCTNFYVWGVLDKLINTDKN